MTEEELSTMKVIGRILEVLGVLILIIDAVLLNMPDKNLGLIGVLIIVGTLMFFTGLIVVRLPSQEEKERGKKER